ncbi:MAG: hypothetical protein ACI9W2_005333 [Gammaproteobacteria bacterium]|jgi:hypothetical protein
MAHRTTNVDVSCDATVGSHGCSPSGKVPGHEVDILIVTTLLASTSKLMVNVETDDYAEHVATRCGCLLRTLGLKTLLRGIRSYEKLSSEGMNYLGVDVISLLDETLPQKIGGARTDCQFVETEQDGIPRATLHVHPQIGPVNEQALGNTMC